MDFAIVANILLKCEYRTRKTILKFLKSLIADYKAVFSKIGCMLQYVLDPYLFPFRLRRLVAYTVPSCVSAAADRCCPGGAGPGAGAAGAALGPDAPAPAASPATAGAPSAPIAPRASPASRYASSEKRARIHYTG